MSDITTLGTLAVNDALPPAYRKTQHTLDKKGVHDLFQRLSQDNPEQYAEVLHKLSDIGKQAVWTEGVSVSLAALRKSKAKEQVLAPVRQKIQALLDDDTLDDDTRRKSIIDAILPAVQPLQDAIMTEADAERSPYASQINSGARGKRSDLNSLKGADLLATDSNDRFMPIPLMNSYAEGFTPAQYFAASYGQRKGALSVKLATADAGFLNKRLTNAAHRAVVTKEKADPTRLPVGLPMPVGDLDNVGAVLAKDAGKLKAGHILRSEDLEDLKDDGVEDVLLHSTLTEPSEDGGVSAEAAGKRTRQGLHMIGDNVGISAAQALGERLSQGTLQSKHSAGVNDRVQKSGIEYINRLIEAPENFPEAGPLSEVNGTVDGIREAPQGGKYITVDKQDYYAPDGVNPTVKPGQQVEKGDDLTDGVPHPRDLIRLRGLGEARRVFTKHFKEALDNSGVGAHRRNVETVVGGLMNWARVTAPDGIGDAIYDDVVPFNALVHNYRPRSGAVEKNLNTALGEYLEEPALHYTPGTQVTHKVAKELGKWGIKSAFTHPEPPDFTPELVRGVHSVYNDPDWKTRLTGFYTSSAFSKALHRGLESDTNSTSYAGAMAAPGTLGKNLGTTGKYGSAE